MLRRRERRESEDLRLRLLLRFAELPVAEADAVARCVARVELLATPRLLLGADRAVPLERKDAALLALLAIDGPVPRARAAALLWPDVDDDKARNSLRQRLFRLRKAAGRDIIVPENALRLAPGVEHDLAGLAQRLADDANAGGGELLGALAYEDCPEFDDWLRIAREQWRGARRNALAETAAQLEGKGHIALALVYAERLVADDPLLEHAHRRLMRLHYLRGDRAAALAAYERCRELLRSELGAQPGKETLDLAALIEQSGALPGCVAAPTPVAVLRPPRLVGRDAEWRALEAAVQANRVALIIGEPGIGKTRLASDFAAARTNAVVIGARPGDARVPYALLARALRALTQRYGTPEQEWAVAELARLLPELGAAPETKLETLRLQQAIVHALAGWQQAGLELAAIDDLHFADAATLEMVPALAGAARLTWLFGVRANEVPDAIAQWLATRDADALTRVELGPLDLPAIEALLASLAIPDLDPQRWAAPLARHTGGNPMFILETLLTLAAQGPDAFDNAEVKLPAPANVGQLIERRLQQLSPEALKLARVAALAGQDFSAELAAAVLHRHPLDLAEAWRELEAAQIIRSEREGSAFAHDLIFEATLRTVPEAIAQVMHRDIARELQERGAPAARVAQHWYDAGEWIPAGTAFAAAAHDARRASQRGIEAQQLLRAAECFDRAGHPDDAFTARRDSTEALLLVHGVERASPLIDKLLSDARTPHQRAAALSACAMTRLMAADPAAGIAAAREAYQIAESIDSPWPRFEAARLLAVGLAQSERAEEALPIIEPFRELIEREGSIEQRGNFWADYAYVLNSARRLRRTADALMRAIENAGAAGDYGELATLTSNYANTLGNLGRVDEALEQAQRARALRAQLGDTEGPAGAAIDMYVGMHCGTLGRYREALASLDDAFTAFSRGGQPLWVAVVNNHRAGLLLDLGQVARAQKLLEYTLPSIDSVRARRMIIAARIERVLGRDGAAQTDDALALLGERGDPYMRMLAQIERSMVLPAPRAVAQCVQVQTEANRLEYLGIAAKARLVGARHLLRSGDARGAASLLREPVPQLRGVQPADMYRAEGWWIEFEVFTACGDRVEAASALARAVDWINMIALPNVPDEFVDSFLNRNPVNRSILTAASRC
jgi:DNA-binding SARP family transcriptional activator/tetratricopeptide (TPR) repeat protein